MTADARDPDAGRRQGRDLRAAIVTGVALAVLFLGSLAVNPWAFLVFIALVVTVAVLELDRAVRALGWRPATPVVGGVGLIMLFGTYTVGDVALSVGVGLMTLLAFLWSLLDRRRSHVAQSIAATMLVTLWVPFLASYLGLLLARPDGEWYVMATVAFAATSDIGAYGFGSAFGRHKMAPSVSPAKTWEGFAGGLLTVLVIAWFVTPRLVSALDPWQSVVLAAAVVVAATTGDLVESMVKRDLGVKDLGTKLPGHGGIMDRIDALLFAVPAAHLVLLALGR